MKKRLFIFLLSILCFFSLQIKVFADNETDKAGSNPFYDDTNVSDTKSVASLTVIADLDIAKAAGITEIKKGFPIEGTLTNLGSSYLRLRSWPWGNVIGQYYEGTKVSVLGESGEFYLVEVNGKQGYMHRNYVATSSKVASGISPDYPGDTKNGGFLSLSEGVKKSIDAASGKKSETSVVTDNSSNNNTPGGIQTGSNGKVVLSVPMQCQYNVKCAAPGSACGPTALAMAMSFYNGQDVSSLSTKMFTATGCTSCGSNYDGLLKAAKNNGFPNAKWNCGVSQSWVKEKIKNGIPLVAHVTNHFVVIKGIDDNGNVIINDPAYASVEKTMSWSQFAGWWQKACFTLK